MNFYVDFEATQPEQEIISIGVISESGETFYSLIKPQFSSISQYISQMTGISQSDVETANSFDDVMTQFSAWCYSFEASCANWKFYSYGDTDTEFLKASLINAKSDTALIITSLMITTMQDYSQEVKKYFRGGTSLIKAFNYLKDLENQQNHNALEDAKMLFEVFNKINDKDPLEENPFAEKTVNNYTFPSGKFYCKTTGKNAKEREFYSIHDAIEWIINNRIPQDARPNVRRDKMATKIMKAIRKKETYMQFKWRRIK